MLDLLLKTSSARYWKRWLWNFSIQRQPQIGSRRNNWRRVSLWRQLRHFWDAGRIQPSLESALCPKSVQKRKVAADGTYHNVIDSQPSSSESDREGLRRRKSSKRKKKDRHAKRDGKEDKSIRDLRNRRRRGRTPCQNWNQTKRRDRRIGDRTPAVEHETPERIVIGILIVVAEVGAHVRNTYMWSASGMNASGKRWTIGRTVCPISRPDMAMRSLEASPSAPNVSRSKWSPRCSIRSTRFS